MLAWPVQVVFGKKLLEPPLQPEMQSEDTAGYTGGAKTARQSSDGKLLSFWVASVPQQPQAAAEQ